MMRLLAFTDIHANLNLVKLLAQKAKDFHCELLVCAGDLSFFGQGIKEMLLALDKIDLPVILIHGNHEDEEEVEKIVSKCKNIKWIHEDTHQYKNYLFMGYGGGGFGHNDSNFVKFAKKHRDKKNVVLLTHQPPYQTQLDGVYGEYTGSKDFREFIETQQPVLAICGHIHENSNKHDMIDKTFLINPGPTGRVIELEDNPDAAAELEQKNNSTNKDQNGDL